MLLTLFELCSLAIREAVLLEKIVSVSVLPPAMRRWVFDLFRRKQLLHNRRCIRLFSQPGFFNDFVSISMLAVGSSKPNFIERQTGYRESSFLIFLADHFDANRGLAANITHLSLCLRISCEYKVPRRSNVSRCYFGNAIFRSLGKLLRSCIHLRQLLLRASPSSLDAQSSRQIEFDRIAEMIDDCILSELEQLTLIDACNSWGLRNFPLKWFQSLQRLSLHGLLIDAGGYQAVLTQCQDTLASLELNRNCFQDDFQSLFPVSMPKLKSLSIERHQYGLNFKEIRDQCPNLTEIRASYIFAPISASQLQALAELPARLELFLIINRSLHNLIDLMWVAGRSVCGLVFRDCDSLDAGHFDLLDHCPNLRLLEISTTTSGAENFLRSILADRDRAGQLDDLTLSGVLSADVLGLVFANCVNVRTLSVYSFTHLADLDRLLLSWIENGARPTSLAVYNLEQVRPDVFRSILRSTACNLRLLTLDVVNGEEFDLCCNTLVNYCPNIRSVSFLTSRRRPFDAWLNRLFNYVG